MNHPFDIFRVFQHWAWAEHVVVERHVIMVSHKERTLQAFQQRFFSDVRIGIVNKDARFRVTVRIDVELVSSAGYAASDEFPVILEVHDIDLLSAPARADLADPVIDILTLFRARHQFRMCVHADRHQMEVPAEAHAFLDLHIIELVARNRLQVRRGIGDGSAEQAAVRLEDVHCMHDTSEHALTPAEVIYFRETFERD